MPVPEMEMTTRSTAASVLMGKTIKAVKRGNLPRHSALPLASEVNLIASAVLRLGIFVFDSN